MKPMARFASKQKVLARPLTICWMPSMKAHVLLALKTFLRRSKTLAEILSAFAFDGEDVRVLVCRALTRCCGRFARCGACFLFTGVMDR